MKKVAIVQSNYIAWKGYFDLIAAVDEFILYDDMQYTRRDWRNRNKIKTPQGAQWLTVPVKAKGEYHQKIRETRIDGQEWALKHWKALTLNYRLAPYFDEIAVWLEPLYISEVHTHLSQLNRSLIESICNYLDINTRITNSWDYNLVEGKVEGLVNLCQQAGASEYISGPLAKNYIDEDLFLEANIKLSWFDYEGYHQYPQLWGDFTHQVTILDLMFNCGKDAKKYMKYMSMKQSVVSLDASTESVSVSQAD